MPSVTAVTVAGSISVSVMTVVAASSVKPPNKRQPGAATTAALFPEVAHGSTRALRGASDAAAPRCGGRWSTVQSGPAAQLPPARSPKRRPEPQQIRWRAEYRRGAGRSPGGFGALTKSPIPWPLPGRQRALEHRGPEYEPLRPDHTAVSHTTTSPVLTSPCSTALSPVGCGRRCTSLMR
jgi:hypothetical protein